MPPTTTQIFDFLEQQKDFLVERRELFSVEFNSLRRDIRELVSMFSTAEDSHGIDIAAHLRVLLSEWLTAPVPFDDRLSEAIANVFGNPDAIDARWGGDIHSRYLAALQSATSLVEAGESLLRIELSTLFCDLEQNNQNYRIYCHRRARDLFESIFDQQNSIRLADNVFLHSLRDYRLSDPFNILIKVGPLRSRGWGSVPDAVKTAPRFGKLIQVVWSGCSDEADFGFDPTSCFAPASGARKESRQGITVWRVESTEVGEHIDYDPDADELKIYSARASSTETRRATLVQIDPKHGVLYGPHSRVLSYAPEIKDDPIRQRIIDEELDEGMYLIVPKLLDADLGEIQAEDGFYSLQWKNRLREEMETDLAGLCTRLNDSGLTPVYLVSCLQRWSDPATTVIRAPRKQEDFRILIQLLDDGGLGRRPRDPGSIDWWKLAWNEIRRSRGEAIQTGRQEHEIVDEQVVDFLKGQLREIEVHLTDEQFKIDVPHNSTIPAGTFTFYRILCIENGWKVPDSALRQICDLEEIDQWRE